MLQAEQEMLLRHLLDTIVDCGFNKGMKQMRAGPDDMCALGLRIPGAGLIILLNPC